MTERLLDRLEDCQRSFPVAAVLGGAGAVAAAHLVGGRAGVQTLLHVDDSPGMLARAARLQRVWTWQGSNVGFENLQLSGMLARAARLHGLQTLAGVSFRVCELRLKNSYSSQCGLSWFAGVRAVCLSDS